MTDTELNNKHLFKDISSLIEAARNSVATLVNTTMTLMYWQIGERINHELLAGDRAAYGKQIVSELATQLQQSYGKRGFQERNLRRMMQFAQLFHDAEKVSELATKLTWSHFIELLALKDDLQRDFYTQMAIYEKWGTKQLREKIDGMLYERSLISGKPEVVIKQELSKLKKGNPISPDLVFKSPYFLDFTGLKGVYSEETPLGLILCAEGGHEQIELLQLENAGIKVAEYMTELPDKKILQQKLHKEILLRKQNIAPNED